MVILKRFVCGGNTSHRCWYFFAASSRLSLLSGFVDRLPRSVYLKGFIFSLPLSIYIDYPVRVMVSTIKRKIIKKSLSASQPFKSFCIAIVNDGLPEINDLLARSILLCRSELAFRPLLPLSVRHFHVFSPCYTYIITLPVLESRIILYLFSTNILCI